MLKSACGMNTNEPTDRKETPQFKAIAATTPDVVESLLNPRSSPPALTGDRLLVRSLPVARKCKPVVVDMPGLDDAMTRQLIADMRERDRERYEQA